MDPVGDGATVPVSKFHISKASLLSLKCTTASYPNFIWVIRISSLTQTGHVDLLSAVSSKGVVKMVEIRRSTSDKVPKTRSDRMKNGTIANDSTRAYLTTEFRIDKHLDIKGAMNMPMALLATAYLTLAAMTVSASEPLTWEYVSNMIKARFPHVPEKTIPELIQLKKDQHPIFLIDARAKKEFDVSHIKEAINLTDTKALQSRGIAKEALIIVYCSVGVRSAKLVSELNTAGYHNSFNLKGSIFAWANSGHLLYRHGKKTDRVHPYNKKWGVLLKEKYHYESRWFW